MERQSSAKSRMSGIRFDGVEGLASNSAIQTDKAYYESMVTRYCQATENRINDANAWYYRGDALANLERYDEALESFDQAIRLRPSDHEAWIYRGVVLIHLERHLEALASCDRALEIRSSSREAWMFRGASLQRLGRYKEAYASFDCATGVRRSSKWHQLMQAIASLLRYLGLRRH